MRRVLITAAALTAAMALPTTALAWHSSPGFLSCGEADFTNVSAEKGWKLTLYQDGTAIRTRTFDLAKTGDISWPVFATSLGVHQMQVTLANATNPNDGKSVVYASFIDCLPPVGTPGPTGPSGPAGPNGPAGPAGPPGSKTTTTITRVIRQAPRLCTSRRHYRFRVRRQFLGQPIVAVRAHEPGMTVNVSKRNGRFVVSWSTAGQKFRLGSGDIRTMTVEATLANGRHVRLVWMYRPCLHKDGNPNDPSASGQGSNA